jgi:hypothetical protein
MAATESNLVGTAASLLFWAVLNCFWLALVRRPAVAALLALEFIVVLVLLSRFKYEKLWMTVDFVDLMIIDRYTSAFLLAALPSLLGWIGLAVALRLEASAPRYRTTYYAIDTVGAVRRYEKRGYLTSPPSKSALQSSPDRLAARAIASARPYRHGVISLIHIDARPASYSKLIFPQIEVAIMRRLLSFGDVRGA